MKIRSVFSARKWVRFVLGTRIGKRLPDKLYIQLEYYHSLGKLLNLRNPLTYNEKLQWLKLYDRNPMYTKMVDKAAVKDYVTDIIGEEYVIPTYGIWDRPEEIPFDHLPDQFVLKVTHDSGGVVICKDKSRFDRDAAIQRLRKSLSRDYYMVHREWPYKHVPRRIIAEAYMEDNTTGELRDYKFFAFNGEVKLLFVATERQNPNTETKFDFFDPHYNHIDLRNGHPNADVPPAKPRNFELMVALAEKLSKEIPHARVDFYEVNGRVYFGEITFSHWSGLVPFDPPEWDLKLGEYIDLNV